MWILTKGDQFLQTSHQIWIPSDQIKVEGEPQKKSNLSHSYLSLMSQVIIIKNYKL